MVRKIVLTTLIVVVALAASSTAGAADRSTHWGVAVEPSTGKFPGKDQVIIEGQAAYCSLSIHGVFYGGSPPRLTGYGNAMCTGPVERLSIQLCIVRDGVYALNCKTAAEDTPAVNGDVDAGCSPGFHNYALWAQGTAIASGGISQSSPILTPPITVYC